MSNLGEDSIGTFVHFSPKATKCVCGHIPDYAIAYNKSTIEEFKDFDIKRTILGKQLKQESAMLGITCGCYAKFHRQVAHIEDAMKKRTIRKPPRQPDPETGGEAR